MWLMRVRMLMVFSQMKPDPRTHEPGCQPERRRRRFAQQQDRDGRADERRAPVRAVPRSRSARTKRTRLKP